MIKSIIINYKIFNELIDNIISCAWNWNVTPQYLKYSLGNSK